ASSGSSCPCPSWRGSTARARRPDVRGPLRRGARPEDGAAARADLGPAPRSRIPGRAVRNLRPPRLRTSVADAGTVARVLARLHRLVALVRGVDLLGRAVRAPVPAPRPRSCVRGRDRRVLAFRSRLRDAPSGPRALAACALAPRARLVGAMAARLVVVRARVHRCLRRGVLRRFAPRSDLRWAGTRSVRGRAAASCRQLPLVVTGAIGVPLLLV